MLVCSLVTVRLDLYVLWTRDRADSLTSDNAEDATCQLTLGC